MLYTQAEQFSLKEYFTQKPLFIWIVILVLLLTGVGFGSFGVYALVRTNDQEIVTSNDIQAQVCEKTADFGRITVYVSGGVVAPGVYILESGDRLVDLLAAAGGISTAADKSYINRQFNLAELVSDGQQVYIPTVDEVEKQLTMEFGNSKAQLGASGGSDEGGSLERLISINSSPKSELLQLSGIGEVRATKIIENRPYSSLQELVEKSVLSQSLFDEIKNKIAL